MNATAGKIRAAVPILGMGLGLYWLFTYSGPYRYLAELQLKHFGSYSPKITLIAICLVFFLLGEFARIVLRGAEREVPGVSAVTRPTPVSLPRPRSHIVAYRPLIICVIPFVMGAYFFLTGVAAGSLRELQVADLAGSALPSHTLYAEVHGYADKSYVSQNLYSYVPLREVPNSGAPIQVLVGVDDNKISTELSRQDDGSVVVRGMLEARLDNEIRYTFEKHGIVLAKPCWVLRTTRNPTSDQRLGAIMIVVSIVLGGVWALRASRHAVVAR